MRPRDRSRLAVLLSAPLGAAVLLLLLSATAFAQGGPGLFIRTACNTSTIPNPVTGSTWCFNSTTRDIEVWNGSTFVGVSGGVTGTGTQGAPAAWASSTAIATGGAYVDVTQFGTWGGTAAQNRAAIQAGLDALPSTGGTLALPTGSFLVDCSTTINVTKPVRVIAQGRSATTLVATCASTPIFTVATASSVKFEHMTLTANVSRTSGGYGIRVAGAGGTENQNSYFNNVQFDQQDVGLYCASCSSFVIIASYFTNNVNIGLLIDNTDTPDAGDSKLFASHFVAGVASTHIFHQAAGGLEAVGNKLSGGLNAYSLNVRNGVTTSVLQFVGNSCEDFTSHCVVMTTTGSGTYANFVIGLNEIRAVGSTGPAITIDAASASAIAHGTVSSNTIFIDQASTRGIEIIHAQDILVTSNTINCGSSSSTTAIYIDATATRPSVGPNKTNNCAIAVENNGILAPLLSGPLTLVPLSTAAAGTGTIQLRELRANGTNFVGLRAPDSLAADITFTLPAIDGSNGDCLVTNGSKVLSFSNVCAGGGGSGITTLNGLSDAVQTFATVNDTNVTLIVSSAAATHTFTQGWTGLLGAARLVASPTSGGIPYFSSATVVSSSAALTNHALVIGGGAGATPKTIAALTNGQLAIGSTAADPVPATLTAGTGISVTNGAGSITIANTGPTGTGAAGRVAFWTGASTFSSDADFLYDSTSHILTVTRNASTLIAPPTDTLAVVAGASASNSYYTADAYAGQGGLIFRRANGTPAAPTALAIDNPIGAIQAIGYSGAAYSTVRGSFGIFAKQNWTGSNQGTYAMWGLTPSNSTTFDEYMRLDADVGLRLRGPNPWADVLAFGAKCDGATNDTAAIANAIASGASVIRYPVGTCLFTTITPVTGQTHVGAGRSVTILKRASGTADMIAVGRDTTSLLFSDLAIDGNNADGNGLVIGDGTAGTFDTTTSIVILRVKFQNFAASSSSTNGMLYTNVSRKIVAVFDSIFTGGSVGIHFVSTSPPLYVSRTVIQTAANAGMLGAGSGFGALVFGSWFYSNRDGISSNINQLHVQHSYIENSTRYGIDFTGGGGTGDLRVIDSFVTCPASGTAVILNITNDATPIDVHGNTLVGGNATCTPIAFTSFPASPTYSAMVYGNKLDNTFATTTFTAPAVVAYGNTTSGATNTFYAGAGNFSGFVGLNIGTPLYRLHVDSGATVQSALFTSTSTTAYNATAAQDNRMGINMPNTANVYGSFGFSIDTTTTLAQFGMKYLGGGLGDFFWKCYNGAWSECMSLAHDGVLTLPHYGGGTGVVTVGTSDSCGAGFRCLRVPN